MPQSLNKTGKETIKNLLRGAINNPEVMGD